MAVITYRTDIAPHLKRGLTYRRLRLQRRHVLDAHDYDHHDAYDPYRWAEKAQIADLLIGLVVLAYFHLADSRIFRRTKSERLQAAPRP